MTVATDEILTVEVAEVTFETEGVLAAEEDIDGTSTVDLVFEEIWVGSPTDPKADPKVVANSDNCLLMVSTVAFV